ncbi:MAG: hypothetical protein JO172_02920, partial [Hyphomicrobiales bacterium]|nr:hypothetical protein [Hyphomicrobiales bacterium]
LALELSLSDWTAVVSAYEAVSRIANGACDARPAEGAPQRREGTSVRSVPISEELLTPMLQEIERGCVALAPYALDIMRLPE